MIGNKFIEFKKRQIMEHKDCEIFFYEGTKNVIFREHFHNHYELYFSIGVDIDFKIDDTLYHLKTGDILLIPPGRVHSPILRTSKENKEYKRIVFWISQAYMEKITNTDEKDSTCFKKYITNNNYLIRPNSLQRAEITNILSSIYTEKNNNLEYSAEYIRAYAMLLISSINRIYAYQSISQNYYNEKDILINQILGYINENFNKKISLKDVADYLFISKSSLSHIFKNHFNISFYTFVQKKRLVVARNNILEGVPINKAWENCGFNDYSSFFRAFKKEYGISPKDFKKDNLI